MQFFAHLAVYSPLIPALLALRFWKRLGRTEQWLGVMLWLVAALSITGRLWTVTGHANNLPFFHTYILLEGLMLIQVFRGVLGDSMTRKWAMVFAMIFSVAWTLNIIWGEGWMAYPASIHGLEALMLISFTLRWFVKLMREIPAHDVVRTFDFWFCSGILIFFSSNLLLFAFSSFIVRQSPTVFRAIWGVHAILSTLLYLIYSIALLCSVRTQKSL